MVKIAKNDVLGARASNAGDRFHELWALRKALALLEPGTPYEAVTVEGIPESDLHHSSESWTAVDVCLMSGGRSLSNARRAEFAQLKYSSASPESPWTTARLSHSTAKKGNNSVARRLADLYKAAEAVRSSDNPDLSYSIRLVSNQPVGAELFLALGQSTSSEEVARRKAAVDGETIRRATGLTAKQFKHFSSLLDFSECGADLLFQQERLAIRALDRLIEGDSRPWHLELLRFISDTMLPSGSREPITEETLLARLGIGADYALYPCPNLVKPLSSVIEREVTRSIVARLASGVQRLAVHGGAGCGKTTAIMQVSAMLPAGSVCVQYDCYGGGSYLDDSKPRHRPLEAFTQLSNELATRLRVPRLLRTSDAGNPARAFKERLDFAAEILRESAPEALLLIAVDAADNAVFAAAGQGEHCFAPQLASMVDLPSNVRIVLSSRTHRLPDLRLPPTFSHLEIQPFCPEETLANVRRFIASPDDNWVREFHDLTRGVPRVQAYAFELSTHPEEAIQFLRPNGKGLGDIFEQSVQLAWRKAGELRPIDLLCAALISLPRPVPLDELAYAIASDLTRTKDLCEDLAPTLVIRDELVSFADEDFEDFVSDRARSEQSHVQPRIADHLFARARVTAYAARHAVQALIAAGREHEALQLTKEEPDSTLFPDPVERRLCQLERMRSALRICRQTGNTVDGLLTLLAGAEALRTSDAIARELARNPDLASRYARESLDRLVLSDEKYVEAHGPVLCHYMAEDAKKGLFAQAERSNRLFAAWWSRQRDSHTYRQHSQELTANDIAAFCRARLATSGLDSTLTTLRRLRRGRYSVAPELASQLLGRGDMTVLREALWKDSIPSGTKLSIAAMLAKAGGEVDSDKIAALLKRLQSRGTFWAESQRRRNSAYLRTSALDVCELIARPGTNIEVVRAVLMEIAKIESPGWKNIELSNHAQIDAVLRAQSMLAELDGKALDVQAVLHIEATKTTGWSSDSGISYEDHQRQSDVLSFFSAYLPFYQARARYIKTGCIAGLSGEQKVAWLEKLRYATLSSARRGTQGMRYIAAESVSSLIAFGHEHVAHLFELAAELVTAEQTTFGNRQAEVLRPFSWRTEAHGCLTEFAEEQQSKISDLKTSSSEKASALLELSRLLFDCSPATSASLFNAAVLILGDIDTNEMRLLSAFDKLTSVAAPAVDDAEAHQSAVALASYGTAVAFRLRDYDHFPWHKLTRAVTHLSAPVALAATARWDDENLAGVEETLQHALRTGLNAGAIPAQYAAACCYLFANAPEGLLSQVLRASTTLDAGDQVTVREILAECEALRSDPNPRPEIEAAIVEGVTPEERRRWVTYLSEKRSYLRAVGFRSDSETDSHQNDEDRQRKLDNFLQNLEWQNNTFDSATNISEFSTRAYARARDECSLYLIDQELYRRMRDAVPVHRRSEHLAALGELLSLEGFSSDIAEALVDGIDAWYSTSLAVRDWCASSLPTIISAKLPAFMLTLHNKPPLMRLIDAERVSTESLYDALLVGLADNLEEFDAPKIYDLVEVIVGLVAAADVATVVSGYAKRLLARVKSDDKFDSQDIPRSVDGAVGRLLYAYLSDIDLTVRWRAAHAARSLFWFEATAVIDELVSLYKVVSERSFRASGAPFYWLAARLWLIIAISRACHDRPSYAVRYADYLLSAVSDHQFPHLPIMALAKQGLLALKSSGVLRLTSKQDRQLATVDCSTLTKKRRPRELDRHDDREERFQSKRRFRFDALDTLRYWFPGMAHLFADVSLSEFVDEVERWIVETWGIDANPWRWDEEPRRAKIERRPYAVSHSHGSLPTIERFSTHLEWHGMWCATGALLESHPLATSEYGDDRLQEKIQSATIVGPTLWASDFRSPKPLEKRFWLPPPRDTKWAEEPSVQDIVELLGLTGGTGWCIVDGDYDRYWLGLHETVHVSSCLVSPATAPALLKALQSSKDVHAHYLPRAGDEENEIDFSPFKLKGWLKRLEGQTGIDSKDDFAEEMSPRVAQPGKRVRKSLKLKPSGRFLFGWEYQASSELVFYLEQWADKITERRYWRETDCVRSKGERLHCTLSAIARLLQQERYDLLLKVQTYRKEYEEHRHSESEEGQSAYYNRYLLLRNGGGIEDANGPIGTWKATG